MNERTEKAIQKAIDAVKSGKEIDCALDTTRTGRISLRFWVIDPNGEDFTNLCGFTLQSIIKKRYARRKKKS